jgi:DNA repair exonuclease SbcCD nuclease subunit
MEYEDFLHKLPENTRYIALGHVHLPIPLDESFKGRIAYPGAPIGLDTADLKETFELGKIGGFRRILRVDLSSETPLVKSLRLENTPRVYYKQLTTRSIDEAKSEVKKLIDEVEPGKYTVVLVDVKGLESASIELENYALELMKSYRKMNLFVKIRATTSELEEYAPSIDITPESKELSIEEIELRVIREYLAKKRINIPPEKIHWLINTLGQGMSGSIEKVIQEILKEIGGG